MTFVLLIAGIATAPVALASDTGYPKLGLWWPDKSYPMNINAIAKHDWVCLEDWSKSSVAKIHAVNPATKVLDSSNACELRYNPAAGPTDAMNFEFAAASPQWILTGVGTTLSSPINNSTTVIPVGNASRFAVQDLVVCENEVMYVQSVGTSSITVERDWIKAPASHAAGVRIAPAYEQWPGSVTMDLTDKCPKVDVGNGPEDWADYNARIGYQLTQTAAWDGLYVDVSNGDKADNVWNGTGSHRRSIDYYRNNTYVADSYAAFNTAWNAGLLDYQTQLRGRLSDKVVFTNGSYPNYAQMNGTAFEAFPDSNGGQYGVPWSTVMFGPLDRGSVNDWITRSGTPNMTTLLTYGDDTGSGTTVQYQKMRFGLGSSLLLGAEFTYAQNQHLLGADPLPWFDEYDNAGAGQGYLGMPLSAATRVISGSNVYRRDFAGGVVLVNGSSGAVTVQLGATFQKIHGTQVPSINDGSRVTAVTLQARDAVILLRVAPTGTMSVAGGAAQTTSANVTINSSVSGATEMRIDPGSGTFGAWTAYAASAPVALAGGYGTNTVRAEYRNSTGTLALSDTIELVRPSIMPAGSFTVNSGAYDTSSTTVTVTNSVTNAATMRFRADSGAWTDQLPYAASATVVLPATDGVHQVYAEYTSSTNDVLALSQELRLTQPVVPAGDFTLAGGASQVTTLTVEVDSNVADASQMRLRVADGSWSGWTSYAPVAQVTMPALDGSTYAVDAEYRSVTGDVLAISHLIVCAAPEVTAPAPPPSAPVTTEPTPTPEPTPAPAPAPVPTGDFTLAGGADQVSTTAVPVMSLVSDATQMRFKVGADGTWSDWNAYSSTAQVTLPAANGVYNVYAEYQGAGGDVLACSHAITLTLPAPVPPSVKTFSATASSKLVALKWTITPGDAPAASTTIERKVDAGNWAVLATVAAPGGAYNDTAVTNRHDYYYRVRVMDTEGRVGPYSDTLMARPRATLKRVAGVDRISTAAAASRSAFSSGETRGVVIATANGYADALAAASLAGTCRGPVLLVGNAGLSSDLASEITRLGVKQAYIVGGTGAVPTSVGVSLSSLGISVTRVAGIDRYDTAAAVAREVISASGATHPNVFVVTGTNYADAVSVSSVAYALRAPVLLTKPTQIPATTLSALRELEPTQTTVIGGSGAVSATTFAALSRELGSVRRVGGIDRYATAAAFARLARAEGWIDSNVTYVATGRTYSDALGAGPAAGERRGALLLTDSTALPTSVHDDIDQTGDGLDAVLVVGGSKAVPDRVVTTLDGILR